MTEENRSPEEIKKAKEKARGIALKNIRESDLSNLAVAYFANKEDSGYGKVDNESVEKFLYSPAIGSGAKAYNPESGEKFDLVYDSLLGSRQDGRRYSGQISEYGILETSAKIIQGSVGALKVDDIMALFDKSYVKIKENYKGKYLSDLAESENEEDKKAVQILTAGYLDYLTVKNVSKSLGKGAESIKSGLEELVREEE